MITKEQFIENVKIKNPKANDMEIIGEYTGVNNPIKCKCKIDGYEWSPIAYSIYRSGCPVCTNRVIVKGINDLWTTHPHIANLLTNPEKGYDLVAGTFQKESFTCPNCGNRNIQTISNVTRRNHISCPSCDDNISTPNKVMYHLLSQLNIEFETEKTFDWGVNRDGNKVKYDFFVENKNILVEMNGLQHYLRPFHEDSRTLEEEQENDLLKRELALSNGVENYIVIDARFSDYEYLKDNILNSDLSKIFDLSKIKWNEVFFNSSKSFVFEISKLWNQGMSIVDICRETHFARNIVRDYLTKGTSAKLCNYSPEESIQRKFEKDAKKVVCIEDKIIYESIEEVGRVIGVAATNVKNCCDLSKENLVSIKKKHYLLYEDFKNMSTKDIVTILAKPMCSNSKSLFCIEENRIFNNFQEIHDWCGVCHATINRYLNGKTDYAGTHPTTNIKLHWRKVTDKDIISSYDLNNLKEKLKYA